MENGPFMDDLPRPIKFIPTKNVIFQFANCHKYPDIYVYIYMYINKHTHIYIYIFGPRLTLGLINI